MGHIEMDPDLPRGEQYRSIFPDRGLKTSCVPQSRVSSLKEIKTEAEEARREEDLKAKVEAAKWRSVEQGCDYDQYRQLLLGADLKGLPVGAIESVSKEEVAPINRRTRRRGKGSEAPAVPKPQPAPTAPPADRDEFERQWRNVCKDSVARYNYITIIPATSICKLFKKGVEEHLGVVLTSLRDGWQDEAAIGAVVGWLMTMPKAFRFDLAVGFLSEAEKDAARELFERLLATEEALLVAGDKRWSHADITEARPLYDE